MQEETNQSSLSTQLGCPRGFISAQQMMNQSTDIASVQISPGNDFCNRNRIQNILGTNFVRSLHQAGKKDEARLFSVPSLTLKAKGIFTGEIKDISSKGYLITVEGSDIYCYRLIPSKGWRLVVHYKSKLSEITDAKISHFNNSIIAIREEKVEIFNFIARRFIEGTTEEDAESRSIEINEDLRQIYIVTVLNFQIFSIQDDELINQCTHRLSLNKTLKSYANDYSEMSCYFSSFRAPYLMIYIVNNEGETQQLLMFELKGEAFVETCSVVMDAFDDEFVPLYQAGSVIINSVYCPFHYQELNLFTKEYEDLEFGNGKIVGFCDPYALVENKDHLMIKKLERQ